MKTLTYFLRMVWFVALSWMAIGIVHGQSQLTITATAGSINSAYRIRDLLVDYDNRNLLHLVVESTGKSSLLPLAIAPTDETMTYDLGTIPEFMGDITRGNGHFIDPRLKSSEIKQQSPLGILYQDRDTKQQVGFRLRFAGGLYCTNAEAIIVKGKPGEKKEVQITLMNPGAVDLMVSCWISKGNDRLQVQNTIAVQMGKAVNLPVTVLIPKMSKAGDKLSGELTLEYSIDVWQKEGKPQAPNQATKLLKDFQVPIQIEVESEGDTTPIDKKQLRPGLKLTKESKTELHLTSKQDQPNPTEFVEVINSGKAAATVNVEVPQQWLSLAPGQADQFLLQPGETQKIKFGYSPSPAVPASHSFEGVAKISLDTRQYADMEPVVITVPLFGTFTKPDDPCAIWYKGQKILRTRPLRPTYSKEGQVVDYTLTMTNCKCIPVTGEMKGAVNVTGFDKGKQQVHIVIKAPPKDGGLEQVQKVMLGAGSDTIAVYYQRTADYIPKEPAKYKLYSYPDYSLIEKIAGMPEGGAAAFYLEFPEEVNLPKQLRLRLKGGETPLDTVINLGKERKNPSHPRSVLLFINATNGLGSSMLEILGSDGKKLVEAEIEIDSVVTAQDEWIPILVAIIAFLSTVIILLILWKTKARKQPQIPLPVQAPIEPSVEELWIHENVPIERPYTKEKLDGWRLADNIAYAQPRLDAQKIALMANWPKDETESINRLQAMYDEANANEKRALASAHDHLKTLELKQGELAIATQEIRQLKNEVNVAQREIAQQKNELLASRDELRNMSQQPVEMNGHAQQIATAVLQAMQSQARVAQYATVETLSLEVVERFLSAKEPAALPVLPPPPSVVIPPIMTRFQATLARTIHLVKMVFEDMEPSSKFYPGIQRLLKGDGEGGLEYAMRVLSEEALQKKVIGTPGEGAPVLRAGEFYHRYIKVYVLESIHKFGQIDAYTRAQAIGGSIDVGADMTKDRVDVACFQEAFAVLRKWLQEELELELVQVGIFQELFSVVKYDQAFLPNLIRIKPEYRASVGQMPNNMVIDLLEVGLKSERLLLNTKPKVCLNGN